MADQYALVRDSVVENIVEWDGGEQWAPPENVLAVRLDLRFASHKACAIGSIYADGTFSSGSSLGDLKAEKRAAVKEAQTSRFAAGWSHDFGSAGTHRLDLRGADDKANWTLLLIKTQAMIGAGAGAAPISIRTADDAQITVPASTANAAMGQFLAWGEAMLKAKWDHDDAIASASDEAALAAIDVEAGWP